MIFRGCQLVPHNLTLSHSFHDSQTPLPQDPQPSWDWSLANFFCYLSAFNSCLYLVCPLLTISQQGHCCPFLVLLVSDGGGGWGALPSLLWWHPIYYYASWHVYKPKTRFLLFLLCPRDLPEPGYNNSMHIPHSAWQNTEDALIFPEFQSAHPRIKDPLHQGRERRLSQQHWAPQKNRSPWTC